MLGILQKRSKINFQKKKIVHAIWDPHFGRPANSFCDSKELKAEMSKKNILCSMGVSGSELFCPFIEQHAMELDRWLD